MLSATAQAAARQLDEFIEALGDIPNDAMRDALLDFYPSLVRKYGGAAASAACKFYSELREASGAAGAFAPTAEEPGDALAESDVRWAMGAQYAGASGRAGLSGALRGSATRRVYQHADRTLVRSAQRDPAHPKWAVVPHAGACAWCVMVGSRGFVYRSERTAALQRHDNCRCTPVVDFDRQSPRLDGYDPEAMREAYARCEEAVHDDVNRQWDAMSDAEKAKYKCEGRSAKDVHKTKRVTKEMDRRDRDWLQDPKRQIPRYEILPGAKPSDNEKNLADVLATDGWKSIFRPVRDSAANPKRTSDVFFRSGHDDAGDGSGYTLTPVEFKQPTGNGRQTVFHQFESAAGQAHWLVLDARGLGAALSDDDIRNAAARNVSRPFKVKTGVDKGKSWEFSRVTVLMRDGSFENYWHE